jgi:anhydro-N-acetylmuramic acid kinase
VTAGRLGTPRAADVAAGGQGAPLAPVFDRALVRAAARLADCRPQHRRGELTYIDGEQLVACDTGPGNALLDDFRRVQTGAPLDIDGRTAASGATQNMIPRLLAHPFFAAPPPKSLDRNAARCALPPPR